MADHAAAPDTPDLHELTEFGSNPGELRALVQVPAGLAASAPLVVALHGCTQTAAGYAAGTGWATLAERGGFALLLPEQVRSNNANGCFNWFSPLDVARRGGEAESIANMVAAMIRRHRIDPARVFVTGLSAGGAMAVAMLATYPDLFAGGAAIGGLPHGAAANVGEALARMRDGAASGLVVRHLTPGHAGAWPTLAIWHGAADHVVAVANMAAIARQWRMLHGVDAQPSDVTAGASWERRCWKGADGRTAVETWTIAGMGHGVPIDPSGADGLGRAGPYMLDVGLSSTTEIARAWGLPVPPAPPKTAAREHAAMPAAGGVQAVVEQALRAAGLMR